MGTVFTHAVNPNLYPNLPYDPVKDFAPVVLVARMPNILVLHPSVPAANVAELIALAKARPGALAFASPGNGTTQHLAGELFKKMAGVDMIQVPYKGNAPGRDRSGGRTGADIVRPHPRVAATGARRKAARAWNDDCPICRP